MSTREGLKGPSQVVHVGGPSGLRGVGVPEGVKDNNCEMDEVDPPSVGIDTDFYLGWNRLRDH